MGNWKERPRRIFRNQKPPWSAIRNYDRDPPLEYWKDGIPLWEKKFCTKIGRVPWGKIIDTKHFIHCHINVVNWDDSACEEAFHNAKRRYWAEINGHQCDIYLPDPDKYIEQIDWSPDMNSELIEELDRAYYDPNMTQSDVGLESKNKRTRDTSSVCTEGDTDDRGHEGNPWEHGDQLIENTGQGWNQWNLSDSGKVNNDENPWESSISQTNRGTVDSAWKDKTHQIVTSWKHKEFSSDSRGTVDTAGRERVHQGGVTSWTTKAFSSDARGMVDNAWRNSVHQGGTDSWKTKEISSDATGLVDSARRERVYKGGVTSWTTKAFANNARGMVDNAWRDSVHQGGTDSWKTKGFASDARNNSWSRHQQGTNNFGNYNRPRNNSYRNARNETDRIRPNNRSNEQDWKYQYRYGKRPKDAEFDDIRR